MPGVTGYGGGRVGVHGPAPHDLSNVRPPAAAWRWGPERVQRHSPTEAMRSPLARLGLADPAPLIPPSPMVGHGGMLPASRIMVAVLLLATLGPGEALARRFSAKERARLARGEVITRSWKIPGHELGTGWAAAVVDASPESVFGVVAHVTRYPAIFPRMTAARIVKRLSGGRYDFYYRIHMPWPMDDLWCVTRNIHDLDRRKHSYRRRWTLVDGTFTHNSGQWWVRPWGKGQTLLLYSVVLRPRMSVPEFVLRYAARVALPRSVTLMRGRVRTLRSLGKLPVWTPHGR